MGNANAVNDVPTRLHHYGSVVRDQAKVREFMEGVLGFPLIATWIERSRLREIDEEHSFCHTFYGLDDGGALAFFEFDDPSVFERCQPAQRAVIERFDHLALRVGPERYEDLRLRMKGANVPFREIDHGYCRSLYTKMEDGLELEFTVDPPEIDEIMASQREHASDDLKRWIAGEREPNNGLRARYRQTAHA